MSGDDKPQQPQPLGVYEVKERIHNLFVLSGKKDSFMAYFRTKAIQHGWTYSMRDAFVDYIKEKGPDNVNVPRMIADLKHLGKECFPHEVKKELEEAMYEVVKGYFTIDDTVTPINDPDDLLSEMAKPGLLNRAQVLGIPSSSLQSSSSVPSSPCDVPGPVIDIAPTMPGRSPLQSGALIPRITHHSQK